MTKIRVPLTPRELDILLGMLGPASHHQALKCDATPEGREREFYLRTLGELNALTATLEKHHPRRDDTSQDAEED